MQVLRLPDIRLPDGISCSTDCVVPRLGTSFSTDSVKIAILSLFQRLGFDRPSEDQEKSRQGSAGRVLVRSRYLRRFTDRERKVDVLHLFATSAKA